MKMIVAQISYKSRKISWQVTKHFSMSQFEIGMTVSADTAFKERYKELIANTSKCNKIDYDNNQEVEI